MGVSCFVPAGVAVDDFPTVGRMRAVGWDACGDSVDHEGASMPCDLHGQEGFVVEFARHVRPADTPGGTDVTRAAGAGTSGGGGIRTHVRLSPETVFKTVAFDRSATPPGGEHPNTRRPTAARAHGSPGRVGSTSCRSAGPDRRAGPGLSRRCVVEFPPRFRPRRGLAKISRLGEVAERLKAPAC